MNPNDPNNQVPQNAPTNPLTPQDENKEEPNVTLPTTGQPPEDTSAPGISEPALPTTGEQQDNNESSDQQAPENQEVQQTVEQPQPSEVSQQPKSEQESQSETENSTEVPPLPQSPPPTPSSDDVAPPKALPLQQTPPPTNHDGAAEAVTNAPAPESSSKNLALASLILGVIGILTGWLFGLGIVLGLVAVVLGGLVLMKHKAGKNLAIAGLATGLLAIIAGVVFLAITYTAIDSVDEGVKTDTTNSVEQSEV